MNMSVAANTQNCVRAIVGKKIVGVMFDALPVQRRDLASGNKTLVFDDGSGFTFTSGGAFWLENADDVARAVALKRDELEAVQRDIQDVLDLAGTAMLASLYESGDCN